MIKKPFAKPEIVMRGPTRPAAECIIKEAPVSGVTPVDRYPD